VSEIGLTLDRFLGGRLTIAQPKKGFRAGHDTVLLAAAVPAEPGSHCLELGAGVGVASLCLAARVQGADVLGVEIDPDLVRLANENAARNAMSDRVRFEGGDVGRLGEVGSFDHVFLNPPFNPDTGNRSPTRGRDRAMRDADDAISAWARVALAAVKPGGTVSAILRADRADEMLNERGSYATTLFPLFPHEGEAPKRVIIRIEKDRSGPVHRAAGLVLHGSDGRNAKAAEAVLRHGAALRLA
jgi:tRNA1(Val) A37 N6-methylase TrmN6